MSNTKQKTALQKAIETLKIFESKSKGSNPIAEKAFQISIQQCESQLPDERQQIIDARKDGIDNEYRHHEHQKSCIDYFNETYESYESK